MNPGIIAELISEDIRENNGNKFYGVGDSSGSIKSIHPEFDDIVWVPVNITNPHYFMMKSK